MTSGLRDLLSTLYPLPCSGTENSGGMQEVDATVKTSLKELHGVLDPASRALDSEGVGSTAEEHLAAVVGVLDRRMEASGAHRGPCTKTWQEGSLAYRCRDCQTSSSSSLCCECFRAGNHEGHDYTLYASHAGGCCDCGDVGSWAAEGCCPAHPPPAGSGGAQEVERLLSREEMEGLARLLASAFQLLHCRMLDVCLLDHDSPKGTSEDRETKLEEAIGQLVSLCQQPLVRHVAAGVVMSEEEFKAVSGPRMTNIILDAQTSGPPDDSMRELDRDLDAVMEGKWADLGPLTALKKLDGVCHFRPSSATSGTQEAPMPSDRGVAMDVEGMFQMAEAARDAPTWPLEHPPMQLPRAASAEGAAREQGPESASSTGEANGGDGTAPVGGDLPRVGSGARQGGAEEMEVGGEGGERLAAGSSGGGGTASRGDPDTEMRDGSDDGAGNRADVGRIAPVVCSDVFCDPHTGQPLSDELMDLAVSQLFGTEQDGPDTPGGSAGVRRGAAQEGRRAGPPTLPDSGAADQGELPQPVAEGSPGRDEGPEGGSEASGDDGAGGGEGNPWQGEFIEDSTSSSDTDHGSDAEEGREPEDVCRRLASRHRLQQAMHGIWGCCEKDERNRWNVVEVARLSEGCLTAMLLWIGEMPDAIKDKVVDLLLLLMLDSDVKLHLLRVLSSCYTGLFFCMDAPLQAAFDRLNVQLLNGPALVAPIQDQAGLFVSLGVALVSMLTFYRTKRFGCHVFNLRTNLEADAPWRMQMDMGSLLRSPALVDHIISSQPLTQLLLEPLLLLEGMAPIRHMSDEHVQYEDDIWLIARSIEVGMFTSTIGTVLESLRPGTSDPLPTLCLKLEKARTLWSAATEAWATRGGNSVLLTDYFAEDLMKQTVSLHHPFFHALGAILHALQMLKAAIALHGPASDCLLPEIWEDGLEVSSSMVEEGCRHGLRNQAWIAQANARLWVRNGEWVERCAILWKGQWWAPCAFDMDVMLLQTQLALPTRDSDSLGDHSYFHLILRHFQFEDMDVYNDKLAPGSKAAMNCLEEGLRFLVSAYRDRSLYELDEGAKQRREIVHILAVSPRTFSEIAGEISADLTKSTGSIQKELAKVAVYTPPTSTAPGSYSLRRECWQEFDPYYLHFTPTSLQTATENALQAGWDPAAQLRDLPPPPPGLPSLYCHLGKKEGGDVLEDLLWSMSRCARASRLGHRHGCWPPLLTLLMMALQTRWHDDKSRQGRHVLMKEGGIMDMVQAVVDRQEEEMGREAQGCVKAVLTLCQEYLGRHRWWEWTKRRRAAGTATPDPLDDDSPEDRLKVAKARQAKAMAEMLARQAQAAKLLAASSDDNDEEMEGSDDGGAPSACCALCSMDGRTENLGMVTHVQACALAKEDCGPGVSDWRRLPWVEGPKEPPIPWEVNNPMTGLHVQACGHFLHLRCLSLYLKEQVKDKEDGWGDLSGVVSSHKGEFFCPVCRRVSNALLPGATASSATPTPPLTTPAAACSATCTHKRKLDDSCIAEEDVAPAVDSGPGLSVPAKGGDHAASNDGAACLFSMLLDNAADVMRDDTPTGRAARDRLAAVLVRDSGQVAQDILGGDYGLTMAFTSICRAVLAVACDQNRSSDVLNFRPGQDSLLPSETYEGLVDAEDFKPQYLHLMNVDCLSIIWAALYHNVVCWSDRESNSGVEDAPGGVAAAQEAHWRAIQLLGALAARCKPPGLAGTKAAQAAVQALEWLNGIDNEGGEEAAMPCLLDTLRPAGRRATEWCQLDPNSARSSFLDLHPMQAAVRTFLDRPAEPDFKTGMEVFHDLPLDEESRRIATKAASLQAGTLIEAATVMLDAMASGDAVIIKDAVATFKCLKGMVDPPGANEHRQALLALAIIADELCDESLTPLEREKVLPPSLSAMDGEVLQVACPALANLVRYPEGVKLAAEAIKAQSCHIFVRVRKQTLCKALSPEAIEELEGYIAMAPALVEDLGGPLDIWTALRAALASMSCYKLMKPKLNPVLDFTYNSWIIPEKVGDKPSMLAHPRTDETAVRMELAAIEGSDQVIWGLWYARRQKWRQVPPDPLLLLLQLTLTAPLPLEQDAATRGLACVATVKAILPAIYVMECIRGALKAMLPYCPPLMEPGSSEKPDASCLYALLLGRRAGCSMWAEALKAAEAAALPLLRRVDVLCSALYGGSRGSHTGDRVSSLEGLAHKYSLPSTAQAVASLQGHGEIGRTLKAWGCATKDLEKDVEKRQCCRGLIDLPDMYQDLYLHLVGKECSRCKKALARKEDSSALCLVCGAVLCCARVACTTTYPGPCCRHAADCGAGVGVFLMLPATKTLVLSHSRAAVLPSLYLDAQGEEDPNMSRGRPLHRDAARWERLQALHANMALDFDTVVLGEAQGGRALKGAQIY